MSDQFSVSAALVALKVEGVPRFLHYAARRARRRRGRTNRAAPVGMTRLGEVAVRVANECVQIHGGYGFIKDYPAEKFYRDVKLCTIGEGTSEIQRLVIARQLLGNS